MTKRLGMLLALILLILIVPNPKTARAEEGNIYLPMIDYAQPPIGSKIAFVRGNVSNDDIYVMNPDGSEQINLTNSPDTSDSSPAWSPDGRHIAFMRVGHSGNINHYDIHVISPNGANEMNLTNTPDVSEWSPVWSPDGSRIAFLRGGQIWLMNADGSGATYLTDGGDSRWSPPAWSPDGTQIAFSSIRNGPHEIFTIHADGTNMKRLTQNDAFTQDAHPVWSPNGEQIAFERHTTHIQIHVMDADGSNLHPVSRHSSEWYQDTNLSWSVDGSRILFWRWFSPGVSDIYVVNSDGKGQTNLTASPEYEWAPIWSPDCSQIAFPYSGDIYVMNADGSGRTNITNTPGFDDSDHSPAWFGSKP